MRRIQAKMRLIVTAAIGTAGFVSMAGMPLDTSSGSGLVQSRQASPPTPLSGPLRDHLVNERYQLVTSVRGLPLGVRDGLQRLFESATLDIADPGAAFSGSDAANRQLPSRRLVAAGCSADHHCLVYYERGGTAHTWRVAVFHWTPGDTRFEWGGTAPGDLRTIEDVRRAVLTGAIKGPAASW